MQWHLISQTGVDLSDTFCPLLITSGFVARDCLDFSLAIILGLRHPGLDAPWASGPPWNSAFKTLDSLSTAVSQTRVWSHRPLSVPAWFLAPWIVSDVPKGPRCSNSHQFCFSYQIGHHVFCESVFLKIIISPMDAEDLHAEKLKGWCWHFLVAICASRRQLRSKCYIVSAKDSSEGVPLRNSLFGDLHFSEVLSHRRHKKQSVFNRFNLTRGLKGNRSAYYHLQNASGSSSHAL